MTVEIRGCRGALHTKHNRQQLRGSYKAVPHCKSIKGGAAEDAVLSEPRRGTLSGWRQKRWPLHKAGDGKDSGRYRKWAAARQTAVI